MVNVTWLAVILLSTGLIDARTLTISWSPYNSSDPATTYTIQRSIDTVSYVDYKLGIPLTTTSFVDTNVNTGVTYCYRIKLSGTGVDLTPSNLGCIQVALIPNAIVPFGQPSGAAYIASDGTAVSKGSTQNNINVIWGGIDGALTTDFIGIYLQGSSTNSSTVISKTYVTDTLGRGSARLSVPSSTANGTYEIRYCRNNTFTAIYTSNTFTVVP